jgi:glutamate formiminotransferase
VLPLESVPNVSEGRDRAAIAAIGAAFEVGGARVLDVHSDVDHHRSVFSLVAGNDDALVEALVRGIAEARARIDLRVHDGVHPRVGAADVVPVVPLRASDLPRAERAARLLARRVGAELGLPVFLYGAVGDARRPAFYRSGGPGELQRRVDAGELEPAAGPRRLDEAAGAVLVGVRPPLVAFNVDLATDDVEVARAIATAVRESSGGMPGVQALGLRLPLAGRVQVSMNVVDVERAPLHEVVLRVRDEARAQGVELAGAELVGLLPASVVARAAADAILLPGLDASRVIEAAALEALV